MANPHEKVAGNALGRFYVDETCIDCGQCPDTAPQFFVRNNEEGFSYVFLRPTTETEIGLATVAMEGCPTESIGCDG